MRHFSGYTLLDGVNHFERTAITDIHQFFDTLKIEQRNIRKVKLQHHAVFFVDMIVGSLHHHRFDLFHRVGRGFSGSGHRRSENKIRFEIRLHDIDREIIINSSVEKRNTIFPDRFEEERKRHGRTHGFAQIAIPPDDSLFIIHIRADATERNKEMIEIPSRLGRRLRVQSHESLIHLDGIDDTLRKKVGTDLHRIGEIDGEMHKIRRIVRFLEIIDIFVFDGSFLPVAEIVREHQFQHLVGRIAHCIEAAHNRPDGGPRHIIDRNIIFFERFDHPQMGSAFRSAATQNKSYGLRLECGLAKHHPQKAKYFQTFHHYIHTLQIFDFFEPDRYRGITGHAPVATGRKADGSDFRAVGHAVSFKLLRKEAAHEDLQPPLDLFGRIALPEGLAG